MVVHHIILFAFKEEADIAELGTNLLSLKSKCLKDGKPYIRSVVGGKDNSPEGMQQGFTHAFIMEFENEADRDYYVESDPAHHEYRDGALKFMKQGAVVDFVDRKF